MKRKVIWYSLIGAVVGAGQTLGMLLTGRETGTLQVSLLFAVLSGLLFAAGTVVVLYLLAKAGKWLFAKDMAAGDGHAPARSIAADKKGAFAWKKPWPWQVILLLCWLPCYIAYFPAVYSYDGEPQLIQYTTKSFDNHHPILHTLILGWCYDLGQFFQNRLHIPLDGMALYALLSMLLLSGAFAYGIAYFAKRGARRALLVAATLWCGLFPVHALMAVSTTKDTFFTAFLVFVFVMLLEAWDDGTALSVPKTVGNRTARAAHGGSRTAYFLRLGLAMLLLMLFRKNGVYMLAGLFFALAAVWLCGAPKIRRIATAAGGTGWRFHRETTPTAVAPQNYAADESKLVARSTLCARLLLVTGISILLFFLCDAGLMKATNAVQGESAEALSMPIQQLARTYKSNGSALTASQLEALYAYLPKEGLDNYRPYISDGVKQRFDNERFAEDPAGFIRIWAELFAEYPGSYVAAALYQTMGSWYISDVSHCMVYQDWWRDRTGYFITDATPVFAGDFVKKENLWPAMRSLYEKIATDCAHQRFLPTKILFSPALYCLLVAFAFFFFLQKRNTKGAVLCTALFVYLLTVLLGPCILVRYVYPFMALAPWILSIIFSPSPS